MQDLSLTCTKEFQVDFQMWGPQNDVEGGGSTSTRTHALLHMSFVYIQKSTLPAVPRFPHYCNN